MTLCLLFRVATVPQDVSGVVDIGSRHMRPTPLLSPLRGDLAVAWPVMREPTIWTGLA